MRRLAALVCVIVVVAVVPHRLAAWPAARWFDGDERLQAALEEAVVADLERPGDFATGSATFDGEWLFGTYMMSGLGFAQRALQHPELRELELARIRRCVEAMISPEVRAFDRRMWNGDDPLEGLAGPRAHVAYLGYLDLLLSLERRLDPNNLHAALNDAITEALARRFAASPTGLLETYPLEVYPVDNTAAVAAIALRDPSLGRRLVEKLRHSSVDAETGLLRQIMPAGEPRGSGTALAAYFLSWADRTLSAELLAAMKRELHQAVLGFGAMREYARGREGPSDVDSGPLVGGLGVSATGFALGCARIHGDRALFESLYASADLFGAPARGRFATGGAIGNAILFAMLTAR